MTPKHFLKLVFSQINTNESRHGVGTHVKKCRSIRRLLHITYELGHY